MLYLKNNQQNKNENYRQHCISVMRIEHEILIFSAPMEFFGRTVNRFEIPQYACIRPLYPLLNFYKMWQIYLTGDKQSLKRTIDFFSIDNDGFEIKNGNDQFYIELNLETDDVSKVREKAGKIVSRISGALKLFLDMEENIQLVESKALRKIGEDGNSAAVFVSHSDSIKLRDLVNIEAGDGKGNITRYPHDNISEFVSAGNSSNIIHEVLKLSSNLENWVNLYRIYEVIEENIGGKEKIEDLGLASKTRIKLFKRTANSPQVLGCKARHGHKKHTPPKNPMSLNEAKALIKNLIIQWVKHKM